MNFTREPIIETVISPKEGYKLVVRNSKGTGQEEYIVDAIEVVSFGKSLFFRSTEKPKAFLVPVSDYEVIETKETRVVLKNASFDRAIKIGGGREAPVKATKEKAAEEEPVVEAKPKRERRRRRRRSAQVEEVKENVEEEASSTEAPKEEAPAPRAPISAPVTVSRLIPPPAQLIADKILKEKKSEALKEEPPAEQAKEKKEEPPTESSESGELQRLATTSKEEVTSTSFSTLEDKKKFSFFGKIW